MTRPFTKEFDNYEACTRWLHERKLSGAIDIMQHGDVVLTLEGDAAERARIEERPLAPGGFHLIPIERAG